MFFRPKGQLPLLSDIHSHLLPGVDDGVRSMAESLRVIRGFYQLGYRRLITTPHVSESYPHNTTASLREGHAALLAELKREGMDIRVDIGAEYMVDMRLKEMLKQGHDLLTWDNHILVETSFHTLQWIVDEVIFELQSRGLEVVLAHPERYPYFFKDQSVLKAMKQRGVLMQVTLGSLTGQYGEQPMKMARKFLADGWVDFLGSDAHHEGHLEHVKKGLQYAFAEKIKADDLANHLLN